MWINFVPGWVLQCIGIGVSGLGIGGLISWMLILFASLR